MKIGDLVRRYRDEHSLSMQEFGDLCNLSKAYISILEKGINPTTGRPFAPTVQTMQKIAEVTGTDINDLLKMLDGDQGLVVNAEEEKSYYHDPETIKLAQELHDNPNHKMLRGLLDSTKDLKPESIKEVMKFIEFQKAKENYEDKYK